MPRLTRFSIAKADIIAYFDSHPKKVFRRGDISNIYESNRKSWRLAKSMILDDFITEMVSKTHLKIVELSFSTGKIVLFTYRDASAYEIALAIKPNVYFSHYTALYLHQLTEQLPKTIYVTFEQAPKHFKRAPLLQENIDKAFSKPQRVSENHIIYGNYNIYLLNGMNTKKEGIVNIEDPREGNLPVTNLERTLIDCAVRPAYSGGVGEVLKAFQNAKEKLSVNKLNATLKKLDFIYPYHQVIGFYLDKAGYREPQINLLRKSHFEYDFYLAYDIKESEYSSKWRLFYPKGL